MKNKFGCNHLSFSYYFQVYIFIYLFRYRHGKREGYQLSLLRNGKLTTATLLNNSHRNIMPRGL